jgi:hypothetical protein
LLKNSILNSVILFLVTQLIVKFGFEFVDLEENFKISQAHEFTIYKLESEINNPVGSDNQFFSSKIL